MKVLVTGGTGVLGQGAVDALLARGHTVLLFSRHAGEDSKDWPAGVEPHPGSVGDAGSILGTAEGCDAIVHCAGIVDEEPPEVTFQSVNVEGTRNVLNEARRAHVRRVVYVSSLGADRGESPYHQSKRDAEALVREFDGNWTILRPGNVYGPGDDVISLLFKMVRTLPLVPVVDRGDQPFEPIWAEDLGKAIAMTVERADLSSRVLELAGPERTSMHDLLDRISKITGRAPTRLPIPGFLASLGARVADMVGIDTPINDSQVTMLQEENVIRRPGGNALLTEFDLVPTTLDVGLRKLADSLPELLPEDGVGALKRKRFWAEIEGCRLTPEALLDHFRRNISALTPWQVEVAAERGTPEVPDEGDTLTLALPLRGHVQVRVVEVNPRSMTFVTVEGHPLAGAVRFLTEQRGHRIRFEIQVYDRAGNFVDWITMATIGAALQNRTWEQTVQNVVDASGGTVPDGVETETATLDEQEMERINAWLDDLVTALKREAKVEKGIGKRAPSWGDEASL